MVDECLRDEQAVLAVARSTCVGRKIGDSEDDDGQRCQPDGRHLPAFTAKVPRLGHRAYLVAALIHGNTRQEGSVDKGGIDIGLHTECFPTTTPKDKNTVFHIGDP